MREHYGIAGRGCLAPAQGLAAGSATARGNVDAMGLPEERALICINSAAYHLAKVSPEY